MVNGNNSMLSMVFCSLAPPKVQIVVRNPTDKPPTYLEGNSLHLECVVVQPGHPAAKFVRWTFNGSPYYRAQGTSVR